MEPNALFSVIIPCYNSEAYLGAALESLLKQSYGNFEALIVNDGSTDNSRTIAESFCSRDSRFVLINQSNLGLSAARNSALKTAKGEIVSFLDSDDVYHEDFLRAHLKFHIQNTQDGAAAVGRFVYINQAGEHLIPYTLGVPRKLGLSDFYECPFPPNVLSIKKKGLECAGAFFNEKIKIAEDIELWIRLFRQGISFNPLFSALSFYRLHAGSMMFTDMEKYLENSSKIFPTLMGSDFDEGLAAKTLYKRALNYAVQTVIHSGAIKDDLVKKYSGAVHGISVQELADICILAFTRALLKPWDEWIKCFSEYSGKLSGLLAACGFDTSEIEAAFLEINSSEGAFTGDIKDRAVRNWKKHFSGFSGTVAFFGAGKNAVRLIRTLKENDLLSPGIQIFLIDECPMSGLVSGYETVTPESPAIRRADALVLSSPWHSEANFCKCRSLFGENLPIIDVYIEK
ncbi:MAG: hypothetical protein A2Y12_00495 [Planctomycetes bacterium GWF2_42_9]|nr:MAG: hypothetical protein A2Y12_00495 [Planctomycetes bacterium GWF2_42_9]